MQYELSAGLIPGRARRLEYYCLFYQLHAINDAAMTPWRMAAEAGRQMLSDPFNPFSHTHGSKSLAAMFELFEATTRTYGKPAFGIEEALVNGIARPISERVVLEQPFGNLLRFERAGDEDGELGQPRLLIVAPMSGHFATLLRGTVREMVKDHDVYITDWNDAKDVPLSRGNFDLDDYIDYVIEFVRKLGPDCHVIAVCQPAVPVLAAVSALSAAKDSALPRSMILMGGPIDTRINPTVPNDLAKNHALGWFERHMIQRVPALYPGVLRRVYPGFLQLYGFMTMNLDRHVGAHLNHYNNLVKGDGDGADQHRRFYDEYRAVMDLPADYYLQTVQRVFQEHQLAVGSFRYRDQLIDPAAITDCALMSVEGENDDISGVGQTLAAHDLCLSLPAEMRDHWEQPGVGHYGVFNGRRWREEIAPRVRQFITRHAG
jgi:poly(3-hydroxybutyrate) depolymerase